MKYLLDTNICIHIIKQHPVQVINKIRELKSSDLAISTITLSELEYGIAKSNKPLKNRLALSEFLSAIEILEYGAHASKIYGQIRVLLEKEGKTIGPLDMLIAAHALAEKLILVTNNEKEFKRIPDLEVENWTI